MDDVDRVLLDIATRFYLMEGHRARAFREESGLTDLQAWARINRLLDDPAAAVAEPERVGRLRRQRDARMHQLRAG
jgi:hypothetical protein